MKISLYRPPGAQRWNYLPTSGYYLYPHQHYKIWFSGNENTFLPDKNQQRLVEFRKQNPNDIMTLVYSGQLLSMLAVMKLYYFCYLCKIIPQNFDNMTAASPTESSLRSYAVGEMTNHKNGGNLAAASDIVRLLSCTKGLGVYSDFDTTIDSSGTPDRISIHKPILCDLSLTAGARSINNDLLYISDFGSDEVKLIQEKVATRCILARVNLRPMILNTTLHQYVPTSPVVGLSDNTNNQLFYFRRRIEEAINQDKEMDQKKELRGVYIATVTNLTGPGVIDDALEEKQKSYFNETRYSFWDYPELKGVFSKNDRQDLSWVPGSYMK
jgi:hypothetical protein